MEVPLVSVRPGRSGQMEHLDKEETEAQVYTTVQVAEVVEEVDFMEVAQEGMARTQLRGAEAEEAPISLEDSHLR